MSYDERKVVDQIDRLTLRELRVWVREGWVRPAPGNAGPVFDELDIARIRLLCDLRKDMSIATDVVPVVLTLIDRLHEARRELRCLTEAIEGQTVDVRRAVLDAYRARTSSGGADAEV